MGFGLVVSDDDLPLAYAKIQHRIRQNRKLTENGMAAFGRNRMSADGASVYTFGAETEIETEIWSPFTH